MGSSNLVLSFIFAVGLAMEQITSASQQESLYWLDAHNAARRMAGTPMMKWNTTLVDYSGSYLNQTTKDCKFMASKGPYGENSMIVEKASTTPTEIVAVWMKEKEYYDSSKSICIKPCYHYTQVQFECIS
ncbi:hypothetical protein H6P81_019432 [Aristolochia fimbriata]|uniref:SCP domain-containing protein n=1 Tax=Aristolochia fimbriata TaxID=158543 RepID=A0AAV7DRS9_ARIFI|nr:hypothetical protein H6P81_019432 [Aristolochia fimbriata]